MEQNDTANMCMMLNHIYSGHSISIWQYGEVE